MSKVSIDKNKLIIDNHTEVIFGNRVAEYLLISDVIVVRLVVSIDNYVDNNVFGVTKEGEILWQIENINPSRKANPYIGIELKENLPVLHHQDGTDLTINPRTGEIINKSWSK